MEDRLAAVAAVEQWFTEYADDIYRYARFVLGDAHLAEDVTQEVFLRALRAWPRYRGESAPKTWLWSILRNHLADVLRKKQVVRRRVTPEPVSEGCATAPFESLLELEDSLQALNPDQRQVFVLRCMQDMSVRDTAVMLGWSESKVKTTLSKAIGRLREILGEVHRSMGLIQQGGEAHGE